MTDINKQKFLAELGKLLTFMYEEDRQTALDMYSEIFDQSDDIQALMNHLVSPTRQAVVIARAYNAKERKLQIYSQSRDEDEDYQQSDEVPAFVQAIADMLPYAVKHEEDTVSADQFSFFDNGQNPVIEGEEEDSPEDEAEEEQEDTWQEAASSEEAESAVVLADGNEPAAGEIISSEETEAPAAAGNSELSSPEEADAEAASEEAEFHEEEAEDSELQTDEYEAEPEAEESETEEAVLPSAAEEEAEEDKEPAYVSKPRIFLLILYIIFAAPITAAGLVILSIPTLLLFAVSIGVIVAAGLLMRGAFSGLSTAADIMVLIGCSVIGFALGLLLLWSFIWFIGGAMSGFVRAILSLGRKWCYKEVQVK